MRPSRCIAASTFPAICAPPTALRRHSASSGGAESCRKGISQLAALLRLRDELDGPEVLIGAGVNAAVIDELRAALSGARAFHASCKTLLESGMTFRREGVPMGLPGLDEWHIQQTDADAVCAAKAAVMR